MRRTPAGKNVTTLTPNDPRHGRYSSYTNHGCRCERCTYARREYYVDYQARRRLDLVPRRRGTESEPAPPTHAMKILTRSPSLADLSLARAGQVVSPVVRCAADEQPSRRLRPSGKTVAALYDLARRSPLSVREGEEVITAILRTPLYRGSLFPDWEKLVAGWAVGHPVEYRAMVRLARDVLYAIERAV